MAIGVWGARDRDQRWRSGPVLGGALVRLGSAGAPCSSSTCRSASIAIVLTALFVPESRADRARRIDPVGQVLVIAALATLTYGIIDAPRAGWTVGPER